jgi:hypothetical protein
MVRPSAWIVSMIVSRNSLLTIGSRPEVGSSRMRSSGWKARARRRATFARCPLESFSI